MQRRRRVGIPAWGNAPGQPRDHSSRAESPKQLIPHIFFLIGDLVFFQKGPELVLEASGLVMFGLVVDVIQQSQAVSRSDGEGTIASLPGESAQLRGLLLDPFRGAGFQVLNELSNGDSAGEADGEMHVVGYASNPETFASGSPCDSGQECVQSLADWFADEREPVFGAEHQVH